MHSGTRGGADTGAVQALDAGAGGHGFAHDAGVESGFDRGLPREQMAARKVFQRFITFFSGAMF